MFDALSLNMLQHYWWIIISLVAGILVFLMFVQGGQTLIYTIGKTDLEKTLLVNSLGRKWEFTFTTLVVFGGGFFASFPLFYSTSFGGAYWLWMSILFCFIIQAIAYEYRSKPSNFLGKRTYEVFLLINGAMGTFLLGVAVSTFFTGSMFSVDLKNITNDSITDISIWESSGHGFEALLKVQNLVFGTMIFFLARVLGLLYFINNIKDETLNKRARRQLWFNAALFILLFLVSVMVLFFSEGFAYMPDSKLIFLKKYKYFINLMDMPIAGFCFFSGAALVLYGIISSLFSKTIRGIWFSGTGTILTVFALFLDAGFNNTAFYPSSFDCQSSITIENSSSSLYTLTTMSYVSILVPFVVAYIAYTWNLINKKQLDANELNEEGHLY
jgi:cytochrome bd ubiquinol oxidase subunit II